MDNRGEWDEQTEEPDGGDLAPVVTVPSGPIVVGLGARSVGIQARQAFFDVVPVSGISPDRRAREVAKCGPVRRRIVLSTTAHALLEAPGQFAELTSATLDS